MEGEEGGLCGDAPADLSLLPVPPLLLLRLLPRVRNIEEGAVAAALTAAATPLLVHFEGALPAIDGVPEHASDDKDDADGVGDDVLVLDPGGCPWSWARSWRATRISAKRAADESPSWFTGNNNGGEGCS